MIRQNITRLRYTFMKYPVFFIKSIEKYKSFCQEVLIHESHSFQMYHLSFFSTFIQHNYFDHRSVKGLTDCPAPQHPLTQIVLVPWIMPVFFSLAARWNTWSVYKNWGDLSAYMIQWIIPKKNRFSLCNKSQHCTYKIYRVKTWFL